MKILSLTLMLVTLIVTNSTASAQNAQKTLEESGLLYKISGNALNKPSYLFGTIHLVCPNDMFSTVKLNSYIDQAEQVVMELDMDNVTELLAIQQGMLLPNGKTFDNLLTPKQLAKVDQLLKDFLGLPIEKVKTIRPIMLQVMLVANPKVIGCNSPASYEQTFLQIAVAKKKPVQGLETAASQLALFDQQPLKTQVLDLHEMASNPQKAFLDFKKLLEIYKKQDSEVLYDEVTRQMLNDKAFKELLLDARNTDWIPKIEKAIKEKPSFIAVGGGHLGGKNGLIKLLRTKGYTVQAIKL